MVNAKSSSGPLNGPDAAAGPLAVSEANSRYFTISSGDDADRRVVYLTGSHIWNNFHDGMGPGSNCAETPEQLDYDAYLGFLKDHGHNFIRLWRWEQFKSQAAGTYTLQWYSVNSRETVGADKLTVESSTAISLKVPFEAAGPAVLYLKKVGR